MNMNKMVYTFLYKHVRLYFKKVMESDIDECWIIMSITTVEQEFFNFPEQELNALLEQERCTLLKQKLLVKVLGIHGDFFYSFKVVLLVFTHNTVRLVLRRGVNPFLWFVSFYRSVTKASHWKYLRNYPCFTCN